MSPYTVPSSLDSDPFSLIPHSYDHGWHFSASPRSASPRSTIMRGIFGIFSYHSIRAEILSVIFCIPILIIVVPLVLAYVAFSLTVGVIKVASYSRPTLNRQHITLRQGHIEACPTREHSLTAAASRRLVTTLPSAIGDISPHLIKHSANSGGGKRVVDILSPIAEREDPYTEEEGAC
ncbi:hypothetical protein EV426DRAFT_95739 [Tirmania nivea]|nr:hypothetical protein EV426DRAFT_95739 [Tirmania nivea]